jgi:hypothetical protein
LVDITSRAFFNNSTPKASSCQTITITIILIATAVAMVTDMTMQATITATT